jgi:tetratricopeptide (TPR) repeat protein
VAFAAGMGWHLWQRALVEQAGGADVVEVSADRRAAALLLIDEAAKARHEERYDEAAALAKKAAEKNPQAASVDMLLAELAFHRGESQILRQATERAMSFPDYESGAKFLLALDHWRELMREGKTDEASRRLAMDLLSQASNAQPSLDATWFFRGNLLRQTGQPAEAHQSLLGSMHRQYPWRSSTLLMERVSQLGGNFDVRNYEDTIDSREGGIGQLPVDESRKIQNLRTIVHWQWILAQEKGGQTSSVGEVSDILNARFNSVPYAKILAPPNDSLRDAEEF